MTTFLFKCIAGVALAVAPAGASPRDSALVAHLRGFASSRIDSSLGAERFGSWLQGVLGPNSEITWEVDDCGEGGDGRSGPTCVTAYGRLQPHGRVVVAMAVGDDEGQVLEVPSLWLAEIEGIGPSERVKRLADLPTQLGAARAVERQLSRFPNRPLDDTTAIDAAKRLSARRLSPRLPDRPLVDWIASLAGDPAAVVWKLEGCDRTRASIRLDGSEDYWACVEALFEDPRETVGLSIRVGTFARGLAGAPRVDKVWVHDKRRHVLREVSVEELPGILESIRR